MSQIVNEPTKLVVAVVIIFVVGVIVGIAFHWLASSRKDKTEEERRPIYWNLIFFAGTGAIFSALAMLMVEPDDRSGIALLFLGLIGGYAASIKELDLAKVELDKLRLEKTINESKRNPKHGEDE